MKRLKRPIIILTCFVLLAVVVIAITVRMQQSNNDDSPPEANTVTVNTKGIDAVIPELPSVTQETINTAVMGIIRKNVETPKDSYDAVYRPNSIEKSQASTGAPIVRFLVDVPDLQRTFVIEIEGNDQTDSQTIYALCPPVGKSAYGEKACNDTP